MVENHVLRANARKQLGGNIFATPWLMVMVAFLIYSAITGIASSTAIGIFIVMGPVMYGFTRLSANKVCGGEKVELGDLFTGFTENFVQSLLLGLLQGLFIWLWSLLFFIPGIIKSYSYSMAFYIMQDDPSKNWKTCLDESRKMMNGYKWQLFCLDLSFIGWFLLGALCFGIGVIFVYPYQMVSRANFYMALKATNET